MHCSSERIGGGTRNRTRIDTLFKDSMPLKYFLFKLTAFQTCCRMVEGVKNYKNEIHVGSNKSYCSKITGKLSLKIKHLPLRIKE